MNSTSTHNLAAGDPRLQRRDVFVILGCLALLYAFLAGLRTVSATDLGWQLATGRWVVQHHSVPSTDVLSYTAAGEPWIYPLGAGVDFLYCVPGGRLCPDFMDGRRGLRGYGRVAVAAGFGGQRCACRRRHAAHRLSHRTSRRHVHGCSIRGISLSPVGELSNRPRASLVVAAANGDMG